MPIGDLKFRSISRHSLHWHVVLIALLMPIFGFAYLYKIAPSEAESPVCCDCAYPPNEQIYHVCRAFLTGVINVENLPEVASQLAVGWLNHLIVHCIEMQNAISEEPIASTVPYYPTEPPPPGVPWPDEFGKDTISESSDEPSTNYVNQCAEQNKDTILGNLEALLSEDNQQNVLVCAQPIQEQLSDNIALLSAGLLRKKVKLVIGNAIQPRHKFPGQ